MKHLRGKPLRSERRYLEYDQRWLEELVGDRIGANPGGRLADHNDEPVALPTYLEGVRMRNHDRRVGLE